MVGEHRRVTSTGQMLVTPVGTQQAEGWAECMGGTALGRVGDMLLVWVDMRGTMR